MLLSFRDQGFLPRFTATLSSHPDALLSYAPTHPVGSPPLLPTTAQEAFLTRKGTSPFTPLPAWQVILCLNPTWSLLPSYSMMLNTPSPTPAFPTPPPCSCLEFIFILTLMRPISFCPFCSRNPPHSSWIFSYLSKSKNAPQASFTSELSSIFPICLPLVYKTLSPIFWSLSNCFSPGFKITLFSSTYPFVRSPKGSSFAHSLNTYQCSFFYDLICQLGKRSLMRRVPGAARPRTSNLFL